MKNLAQEFLTKDEQNTLIECVMDVEKQTSGEIVPVIASMSYDYSRAAHLGGLTLGILTAVIIAMLLGREDMWVFLGLFLAAYVLFSRLLGMVPVLKKQIGRASCRERVCLYV